MSVIVNCDIPRFHSRVTVLTGCATYMKNRLAYMLQHTKLSVGLQKVVNVITFPGCQLMLNIVYMALIGKLLGVASNLPYVSEQVVAGRRSACHLCDQNCTNVVLRLWAQ
jgi:hypothetical protein